MPRPHAALAVATSVFLACNDHGLEPVLDVCDDTATVEAPAAIRSGCRGTTIPEAIPAPWTVETRWAWPTAEDAIEGLLSATGPAVAGPLLDSTEDGLVDERDATWVVVGFVREDPLLRAIVALDGRTGRPLWINAEEPAQGTSAIADVDGDGLPEVIAVSTDDEVIALRGADGALLWRSVPVPSGTRSIPVVTDLDGDGQAEVLAGGSVLSGMDGSWLFSIDALDSWSMMSAADLDRDGVQEILANGSVYDAEGGELWRSEEAGRSVAPAVLQVDDDDDGEVVWLGDTSFATYEPDGEQLRSVQLGERDSDGPLCAGDFDGDGEVEVAWTQRNTLGLFELDGTERWAVEATDSVLTTPCSGFDVDGDGVLEVLYSDTASFRILRGVDGEVLYEDNTHRSNTGFEYPTVADVDGDGHAEILLVGSTEGPGLVRSLAEVSAGWPPAGPGWGAWDFAVTNANAGARVPRSPEPSWLAFNTWRARPATDGQPLPDLLAFVDACGDSSRVLVTIENGGPGDVGTSFAVSAYDGDTELSRQVLQGLGAGTRLHGLVLDVTGSGGEVRIVVDADGVVDECDEANNAVPWER